MTVRCGSADAPELRGADARCACASHSAAWILHAYSEIALAGFRLSSGLLVDFVTGQCRRAALVSWVGDLVFGGNTRFK